MNRISWLATFLIVAFMFSLIALAGPVAGQESQPYPTPTPEGRLIDEGEVPIIDAQLFVSAQAPEEIQGVNWVSLRDDWPATHMDKWWMDGQHPSKGSLRFVHPFQTGVDLSMYDLEWRPAGPLPMSTSGLHIVAAVRPERYSGGTGENNLVIWVRRLSDGKRIVGIRFATSITPADRVWTKFDVSLPEETMRELRGTKFGLDVVAYQRENVPTIFGLDEWGAYYTAAHEPTPTPTPTRTPTWTPAPTITPRPTATPTASPTLIVDEWGQGGRTVVRVPRPADQIVDARQSIGCFDTLAPRMGQRWSAATIAAQSGETVFSPAAAIRVAPYCMTRVTLPPASVCLGGQERRYTAKDDGPLGWVVEVRCRGASTNTPVLMSVQAQGLNSGGNVVIALVTVVGWAATRPEVQTFVLESAEGATTWAGKVLSPSYEAARHWLFTLAFAPRTAALTWGEPSSYSQLIEVDEQGVEGIVGAISHYRPVDWGTTTVWAYDANRRATDEATVAILQSVTGGVLVSRMYSTTPIPGVQGRTLFDAVAADIGTGYNVVPIPGIPPRTGPHSDLKEGADPVLKAKKDATWVEAHKHRIEIVLAGLGFYDWCGTRLDIDENGVERETCACVKFDLGVFREIFNGAGKLVQRWTKGLALVYNPVNPTVLLDLKPKVGGDGRPRGPEWERFEKIDQRNPPPACQCLFSPCWGTPAANVPPK